MSNYYPIDEEYLAQTDQTIFDIAQQSVNLAASLLQWTGASTLPEDIINQAMEVLLQLGDYKNIDLPKEYKRHLLVSDYREEEVQAMEKEGKA